MDRPLKQQHSDDENEGQTSVVARLARLVGLLVLTGILVHAALSIPSASSEPSRPGIWIAGEASARGPAEHWVDQKDKQFSRKHLRIRVGDTVSFTNSDPYAHNIYSLSKTKPFDLGSYQKGEVRKAVFEKPGKVEVECAIHHHMKLLVEVVL